MGRSRKSTGLFLFHGVTRELNVRIGWLGSAIALHGRYVSFLPPDRQSQRYSKGCTKQDPARVLANDLARQVNELGAELDRQNSEDEEADKAPGKNRSEA